MRRRATVPIAADESIRRAEDPMRVVALEAADIAVLKVQPLGGVRACLRIAEQIGLPVVVSSALESSVGIAPGWPWPRRSPSCPTPADSRPCSCSQRDLVDDPLLPVDGVAARTSSRSDARPPGRRGGRRRDARALVRQDRRRAGTRMNPSTALATVLVDELIRCGVREAVLAPGSRSAPLAFALHAADADGRLRLHVRIDERSAGFLALGLAEGVARAPVPVVTTSGTAAANLHPAVARGLGVGHPLARPDGRPTARAARGRGQPDRRPDQALRRRRPAVPRGRGAGGARRARTPTGAAWSAAPLPRPWGTDARPRAGPPQPRLPRAARPRRPWPSGWPESLDGPRRARPWTGVESSGRRRRPGA